METKQKEIYILSAIFTIFGLFLMISAFDSGGWTSQKITILFGGILGILGITGFVKPSVGEVILHWAKNVSKSEERSIRQHQHKPVNSPQSHAGRDVNITYQVQSQKDSAKKTRDIELLKHIYNNRRKGLFTSKELAKISNKDLEDINESLKYFQEKGWVSLGNTDEHTSFAIIMKAQGIDVVEDNNG